MRCGHGREKLYHQRIRRRRSLGNEIEKSIQAKDREHQSQQVARNHRNNLHTSPPSVSCRLDHLRVRLHSLKVRRKKRIAILPLIECRSPPCRQESRILHTKEAKDRPQIRLDKVERGHLRLRIIYTASRDDERRLLACEQSLRYSIPIGKGS